jgi:hypothetical protein
MSTTRSAELREAAETPLATYFAYFIRHVLDDDRDHSGPEDAATVLAEDLLDSGEKQLMETEWRDLLERF